MKNKFNTTIDLMFVCVDGQKILIDKQLDEYSNIVRAELFYAIDNNKEIHLSDYNIDKLDEKVIRMFKMFNL